MTDTTTGEHWLTRNIRAEMARAGVTAAEVRHLLPMGETAWSARMRDPGRWTVAELLRLQRITGAPVAALVTHPDTGTCTQVPR